MAFDDHRNRMYAEAIQKAVTPDSIVLDLGAGIGVLGLIAAAAGAKRVYLVEPEPIVKVAMDIARANNLADKIVILEGKIEDVELPEKVDVIVSVFTGNLLFSEDLLPSLFYARDKYLKPQGKLIPDLAELCFVPVSANELHSKHIGRWSETNMGMDFSSARRFASNEVVWLDRKSMPLKRLSEAVTMISLDLTSTTHVNCDAKVICAVNDAGLCHGLLGWIRIRLGEDWLSTDPDSPEVHWTSAFLPFDPPIRLEIQSEITLALHRPFRGDWTWSVASESGLRRQSTFLAKLDGLQRLKKLSPDHRPGMNSRGKDSLHVLSMMQKGCSNQEIASSLIQLASNRFQSTDEALQFVRGYSLRYANDIDSVENSYSTEYE